MFRLPVWGLKLGNIEPERLNHKCCIKDLRKDVLSKGTIVCDLILISSGLPSHHHFGLPGEYPIVDLLIVV